MAVFHHYLQESVGQTPFYISDLKDMIGVLPRYKKHLFFPSIIIIS